MISSIFPFTRNKPLTYGKFGGPNCLYYKEGDTEPFTGSVGPYPSGELVNGIQHGVWKHFHGSYPDYSKDLMSEGEYKNGKRTGFWLHHSDFGYVQDKGNYKDGERTGLWEGLVQKAS